MTRTPRILVVDDEPAIRLFLGEALRQAGYDVFTASSGEEALARLQAEPIDLVVLDLMMDGLDGLQVMTRVGQQSLPPAVIILTAHASLNSAVEAMRRGGCDYLLKPCRTEELLASVERGLASRRASVQQQELLRLIEVSARQLQRVGQPDPVAQPGPLRFLEARGLLLDREQGTITRQGRPLAVTRTEFRLLVCLMERAGQLVSIGELMKAVHGSDGEKGEARQALATHLWRLRAKLGNAPDGQPYLTNVRGAGHRLDRATPSEPEILP